jgi:hypothetical protein
MSLCGLTSNNISSENENRKVSLKNMCLINESREVSLKNIFVINAN